MALATPKPAHGPASSVSSLDSISSEGTQYRLSAHSRRPTLLRDSIESSNSSEHLGIAEQHVTQPVHLPLSRDSKAQSSYKPGPDEQSLRKRLRERASLTKYYPRLASNRSAWPPPSTRDLLKEAGDWLDAQYPVTDVQNPGTNWHSATSPGQEDFPPTSPSSSRPTTSSTSRDEVDKSNEKLVYVPPETRLKDLMEQIKKNADRGTGAKNSREERVKALLKEMQDKDEERAIQTTIWPENAVELENTEAQKGLRDSMPLDASSERSASLSGGSCGSTNEAQAVDQSPSEQSLPKTHFFIDLPTEFDQQLSVAIDQALNSAGLPKSEQFEADVAVETKQYTAETPELKTQPIEPADSKCVPEHELLDQDHAEINPAFLLDQDGDSMTPTANDGRNTSELLNTGSSSATEQSEEVDSLTEDNAGAESSTSLPLSDRSNNNVSVFSELDDLIGAFRAQRQAQQPVVRAGPG